MSHFVTKTFLIYVKFCVFDALQDWVLKSFFHLSLGTFPQADRDLNKNFLPGFGTLAYK
jgi:hypothetical protein